VQRRQQTKTPASEQFRQQLAEARNEIQNLRTQQALDAALREITTKEHNERILRLEMVIAACVELIPRVPGYLQRMIEVDAGGALKMSEQSTATAQLQYIPESTSLLTPQLSSSASQGASSSPGQASASRGEFAASTEDFFTHGGADFGEQYLFDPTLPT
jgi:hypothetical protein